MLFPRRDGVNDELFREACGNTLPVLQCLQMAGLVVNQVRGVEGIEPIDLKKAASQIAHEAQIGTPWKVSAPLSQWVKSNPEAKMMIVQCQMWGGR